MTSGREARLGVYRMPDILFVRGEGSELIDDSGKRYLDFTSGIGVNALGHGSPVVRGAIERALDTGLIHVSNLFRTEPPEALAAFLTARTGLDRVFLCNSGAESVEGALKCVRKWAKSRGGPEKHRIVALSGSFHGRLFGSLAVTDRPEYRQPYEPLMPGVDFVSPADLDAVNAALSAERTAAMILEPIQGEGGIRPLPLDFIQTMRRWTEERNVALILDEVQCGLGRAGTFCAHEPSGIRPDVLCLAKPLGGGLPMGAVVLTDEIASQMQPGDHGTTFGGGPLVSTVALAVLEVIAAPAFLETVRARGKQLSAGLEAIAQERPGLVKEIRGRGLIWGIEVSEAAAPAVVRAREQGLLTVPAGANVLRLLPPLTVAETEIGRAVSILGEALA